MTPGRWREITAVFHRALELDEPRRASFLEDVCAGDPALRDQVAAMLSAHQEADAVGTRAMGGVAGGGFAQLPVDPDVTGRSGLAAGGVVGRYRIERLLGRGGMGSVFLAYDTTLHRKVALKVLDGPIDDEAASRGKLLREARNAAALSHPGICTIHEVGEAEGTAFIAMEFVEGRSLRDRLDEGSLPLADAVRYGILAADALAYAHEHGVVHRDFKAANAIVSTGGRLTIVDFGLARRGDGAIANATTMSSLVPSGAAAGTPYAMAPEQIRGEAADARTDVWALGVLLHEMTGGAKPFTGETLPDLFSSILRDPPAALNETVPAGLASAIARCLAKDPGARYQNAREVHDALAAVALDAPRRGAVRPRAARRWIAAAAVLAAATTAVLGLNLGGLRDRLRGTASAPPPITLAVLPFQNLTGDPAQEYLSDGLTEELISQLGRLRPARLQVIARTSSMRYKRADVPLDQIGRALGVEYIVEGSARREGDRLRVDARLIRVSEQTPRWNDSFERQLSGVLGLQSDIARAVARALAVTLLPDAQRDLDRPKVVNAEAYEAYLTGRSHALRLTQPDLDTAERYFDVALAKDPSYALGYVGQALVWTSRQQMQFVPPAVAAPRIRAAASKALELDEQLPEAHLLLAMTYTWTDWNWTAAEPEFERAIELRPNYAEARAFYAHYLLIMGRPAEAQVQIQQAKQLDPLSEFVQAFHAVTLFAARRFDDAGAELRSVLKTNPNSPMALTGLPEALHYAGRYDEAFEMERVRWRVRGDREIADALDRGRAEAGYPGAMLRAAELLAARAKTRKMLSVAVAKLYGRAGQHEDQELEWLETAMDVHDPNVPYVGILPNFDHLHAQPRFRRLLERLKLPS